MSSRRRIFVAAAGGRLRSVRQRQAPPEGEPAVMWPTNTDATLNVVFRRSALGGTLARTWADVNGDYIPQGDPLNPSANGELGPSTNVNFGKTGADGFYEPEWAQAGFGGNFLQLGALDRRPARSMPRIRGRGLLPAAGRSFTVTKIFRCRPPIMIRIASRLRRIPASPGPGGERICGLYYVRPAGVGLTDRVTMRSSNFGTQSSEPAWVRHDRERPPSERRAAAGRSEDWKIDDRQLRDCRRRWTTREQVLPHGDAGPYPGQVPRFLHSAVGRSGRGDTAEHPRPSDSGQLPATNAGHPALAGRNLAAGANGTAPVKFHCARHPFPRFNLAARPEFWADVHDESCAHQGDVSI